VNTKAKIYNIVSIIYMLINLNVIKIISIILTTDILALQYNLRNKILVKQNNRCGLCNASFSKMIPHEIHHLNHNSSDNIENNLLALCCNCHASHHRHNISVKPYFQH
jgi:predicted restriction endonuclease